MSTASKKIGLVLSGGGGKGAFEIGVWKAMNDWKSPSGKSLTDCISVVSGTSVGALNAALFAEGDIVKAEELWKNISDEKLLIPQEHAREFLVESEDILINSICELHEKIDPQGIRDEVYSQSENTQVWANPWVNLLQFIVNELTDTSCKQNVSTVSYQSVLNRITLSSSTEKFLDLYPNIARNIVNCTLSQSFILERSEYENLHPYLIDIVLDALRLIKEGYTTISIKNFLNQKRQSITPAGIIACCAVDLLSGRSSIFSNDGLKMLISEAFPSKQLRVDSKKCIVTTVDVIDFSRYNKKSRSNFENSAINNNHKKMTCYNILNKLPEEEFIRILLSSAALPVVYPNLYIEGHVKCDGGVPLWGDNTPIEPLHEECSALIVVHLNNKVDVEKINKKYSDIDLLHIVPSQSLGNFFTGTCNFNPTVAQDNIKLGYENAKAIFAEQNEMIRSWFQ